MTHARDIAQLGLTIEIKTHRKEGNGAKGGGRKGNTGKKGIITKQGEEPITVTGNTARELLGKIRKQFKIPPHVSINQKGMTSL
jgi:hypothetical protein